jgi:hypothetical protein
MSEATRARRARDVKSRASVRRWEYRQRNLSKGTWIRLARTLADAREAWLLSEADALRLEADGFVHEPVGEQLEPAKRILFVPEAHLAELESRRALPIHLGPELLGARFIALVRF